MLKRISIENFKGIGDKVSLDLRPITLLFGANSAGKSSILHALHYAREIFERHNLDADETVGGGKYVNLGGFQHFVHRDQSSPGNLARDVGLTFDIQFEESFYATETGLTQCNAQMGISLQRLMWSICSASLEIRVGWSSFEDQAFVREINLEIEDQHFGSIKASPNLREVVFTPNLDHHMLFTETNFESLDESTDEIAEQHDPDSEVYARMALDQFGSCVAPGDGRNFLFEIGRDALRALSLGKIAFKEWDEELPGNATDKQINDFESRKELLDVDIGVAKEVITALLDPFQEAVNEVRKSLLKLRYVGPLRETPGPTYSPPTYSDPSRWASGLGAWDLLHTGSGDLVAEVNDWLFEKDKLDAGCSLERRRFVELDLGDERLKRLYSSTSFDDVSDSESVNLSDLPFMERLLIIPNEADVELRPQDVGVGISQIIPVIVTALDEREGLLAIEQPELHLHPRLQAEIGDLFIEACHDQKHAFIIETHSEHLILRLLRRIRETKSGQNDSVRSLRPEDLAVCYLTQENGCSKLRRIDVDRNGEFIQPWPDDFFEIDFNERFGIDKNKGEAEY